MIRTRTPSRLCLASSIQQRQLLLQNKRLQHTASTNDNTDQTALQKGDQIGKPTKLNYAFRSVPETYGQVVDDAEAALSDPAFTNANVRVVTLDELRQQQQEVSPEQLNSSPKAPGLSKSQAARLDPATAAGKSIGGKMLVMPQPLASKINQGLQYFDPQKVRANTSKYYISLQNGGPHKPSAAPIDVDTHVAGVLLQNYASAYNVLSETRKRAGREWRPERVLDVGFGPATGMLAFNEIFASELKESWRPKTKTAVVIGHPYMLKRARTILSAQSAEDFYEPENRINTKIQSFLPQPKVGSDAAEQKYDLIMATHQLFRGIHHFPTSVDDHASHLLNLLAPGGVLVLIERGDPNGFETIARARQIMFRPEDYPRSAVKTPRVWKGGRHINDSPTATTNTATEERKPVATEEDPDFELPPELLAEFDVVEEVSSSTTTTAATNEPSTSTNTFKLEILAPCPHHGACPLQLNPTLRQRDTAGVFSWCKFAQLVQRPKFSVELKKGVFLATKWSSEDAGRAESGKGMGGSGRPGGRGHETSTFSYLVVRRPNELSESASLASESEEAERLSRDTARILKPPLKRDAHVILQVCTGSTNSIEHWTVPKSFSKQAYHDARKASGGDLWALGAKTRVARRGGSKDGEGSGSNWERVEALERKREEKEAKMKQKLKKKEKAKAKGNKGTDETEASAATGEGFAEQELQVDEDGPDYESEAWSPQSSTSHNGPRGARSGRKRTTTTLRGHDPFTGAGDEDEAGTLEDYFKEIAEVEQNSSKFRQADRKLKKAEAKAAKKRQARQGAKVRF